MLSQEQRLPKNSRMETIAKKFKQADAFDKANNKYELLPCRFIHLESNRYLLTNEVGEFIVVDRNALDDFVNKRLTIKDQIYSDLKSKHFLYDGDSNVAVDLLTLKTRTKYQSSSQFTSLHIFVVTLRCDYSCKYCQVSRQTNNKHTYDMDFETAKKSLAIVFKSPSDFIKIEFQGGEPLLNFAVIEYVVIKAKEINDKIGKKLDFVIATNLSLIDDYVLNFCLEHDIYISTSLDGPEDLHNKNRPRPGRNGYQVTVEGISRVQRALGKDKISAIMTTTESSLTQVHDIIDTYISLGFDSIFLRSVSPFGFAAKNGISNSYDIDQWFAFYKSGLDYILEINRQGVYFVEYYASIIVTKVFSPFGSGYVDLQSPSGILTSVIVFNYDGDVYASDEARMLAEMGDKTFKLGNLNHNSYQDILLNEFCLDTLETTISESAPMCHECGFMPYCGSDPVYHYATQKDVLGHKALSGFCKKQMKVLRHIFTLLEDDQSAREIIMNWIQR